MEVEVKKPEFFKKEHKMENKNQNFEDKNDKLKSYNLTKSYNLS